MADRNLIDRISDEAERLAETMRRVTEVAIPPGLQKTLDEFRASEAGLRESQSFAWISDRKAPPTLIDSPGSAAEFYRRLRGYISDFEAELAQEHEICLRLVSFGSAVQFHLESIGYWNPALICFRGRLDDGTPVKLVQHVNQISILLMAAKRTDTSTPRQPIGFSQESCARILRRLTVRLCSIRVAG